jgi:hypothetical protein
MNKLLDSHLNALAGCMGRHLRGFDDPRVHLGTETRFAGEFKKVLDFPALRVPDGDRVVSYSEAVGMFCAPASRPGAEIEDPVSTMMQGLAGPQALARKPCPELAADRLFKDLSMLLRTPLLRFYLQVADPRTFQSNLQEMAGREGFPLAFGLRESELVCPSCRAPLSRGARSLPARCIRCKQTYETATLLPMVSGAAASISYEMLRRMVGLESVLSYQEEGEILPASKGEPNL